MRNLVVISGFGEKGLDELARSIRKALPAFDETVHIRGCPWWRALHSPEGNMQRIRRLIDLIPDQRFILSHSGSGHLVATSLAEDPIPNTPAVFLDCALSPYATVRPPPGNIGFKLWKRQYNGRHALAHRCVEALEENEKAVDFYTIGSGNDYVVPGAAKKLPGVPHSQLSLQGHSLYPRKIEAVTAIVVEIAQQYFAAT